MVFLRSFGTSKSVWINTSALNDVQDWILNVQNIQISDVSFYSNGVKIDDANGDYIFSDVNATVEAILHLPGGKGGFGSMLRSIGAQIEKTTNREACRDLSGRRLRDINEETRLRQFVNQQAERERQAQEKKAAKLEKLRKFVTEGESKHEFFDPKYDSAREEATENVHEAVEQAFAEARPSTSGIKRKADDKPSTSSSTTSTAKPKALWIGVDLNDSDLDSSSDDEDEKKATPPKKTKLASAAVKVV